MEDKIDYSKIKWMPAIPMPTPFDVKKRIQELHSYLDPKSPDYLPENQHTNVRAVIKLYEEGKIDGTGRVYIKGGKIVPEEEIFKPPAPSFVEGIGHQYAQKNAYGHGQFGVEHHEIRMRLRLTPALGGDGTVLGITVINDTGSDMLTIFDSDLQSLGNSQGYTGWQNPMLIIDATGTTTSYPTITVQVQLVRNDNSPLGGWIDERALYKQRGPDVPRLSGYAIRRHFYFGTAPIHHHLAVATTKGGMQSLL